MKHNKKRGKTVKRLFCMFIGSFLMLFASNALAKLGPETISSQEIDPGSSLVFVADAQEVGAAVKSVFADKKWKLLYEGNELPKKNHGMFSNAHAFSGRSGDKAAWEKAGATGLEPRIFLQAKTPTSAFSFGTELFVVVYESKEAGSLVSIVASTSQIAEKKKMQSYISELAAMLNEKMGTVGSPPATP